MHTFFNVIGCIIFVILACYILLIIAGALTGLYCVLIRPIVEVFYPPSAYELIERAKQRLEWEKEWEEKERKKSKQSYQSFSDYDPNPYDNPGTTASDCPHCCDHK